MVETLKVFLRNKKAAIGLVIVLAYVAVAVFGPLLLGVDPMDRVGRPHVAPDGETLMGTTRMGRDVFTQLIYGTRTSLAVGFFAGLLVVLIGTVLGIAAGYFGGIIDEVINFCTNIVLVIPQLPLLLVIAAFVGETSPVVIAIIIGITSWAWGARVTRAQTVKLWSSQTLSTVLK